jgi:hypothetical protein
MEDSNNAVRADKKVNVPVVMTLDEVAAVISLLEGTPQVSEGFSFESTSSLGSFQPIYSVESAVNQNSCSSASDLNLATFFFIGPYTP